MSNEINNYVLESIPKIVSFIIYLFIIPSIYADILGKGSFNQCFGLSSNKSWSWGSSSKIELQSSVKLYEDLLQANH